VIFPFSPADGLRVRFIRIFRPRDSRYSGYFSPLLRQGFLRLFSRALFVFVVVEDDGFPSFVEGSLSAPEFSFFR